MYFFSASRWPSASALSTFWPPRTASIAASSDLRLAPNSLRSAPIEVFDSAAASTNSSLEMNWSPRLLASFSAAWSKAPSSRPGWTCSPPCTCGRRCIASSRPLCSLATLTPARASSAFGPSVWASMAASTWAGSMYGLSRVTARLWASPSASWKVVVSLSIRMAGCPPDRAEVGRPRRVFKAARARRLDSAQQDGLGDAEADRRAGQRADHVGERVAEREQRTGRAAA